MALTAILGQDYFRYGHSFIHQSNDKDQGFHKDSHLPWSLRGAVRSHRPNWAMAFYYPQTTTLAMGATRIIPGSQYWNVNHEVDGNEAGEDRLDFAFERNQTGLSQPVQRRDEHLANAVQSFDPHARSQAVEVPRGSIAIVNFALVHRGARNETAAPRFMLKFWFCRTRAPRPRSRPHRRPGSQVTDSRRSAPVTAMVNWLTQSRALPDVMPPSHAETEADRLASAYCRAMTGDLDALIADLLAPEDAPRRAAMYGLAAVVGRAQKSVVAARISAIASGHCGVRKSGAFVLGELGVGDVDAVVALTTLATSGDRSDVRCTAVASLGRICRDGYARGERLFDKTVRTALSQIASPTYVDPAQVDDDSSHGSELRRSFHVNALRQTAAVAILSIVSEAILAEDQDSIGHLECAVLTMLGTEYDRYAAATHFESLTRLAAEGRPTTVTELARQFRRLRWTPAPDWLPGPT